MPLPVGSEEPAKKKNQIVMASTATPTLMTMTTSSTLRGGRLSWSPRMGAVPRQPHADVLGLAAGAGVGPRQRRQHLGQHEHRDGDAADDQQVGPEARALGLGLVLGATYSQPIGAPSHSITLPRAIRKISPAFVSPCRGAALMLTSYHGGRGGASACWAPWEPPPAAAVELAGLEPATS